MTTHDYSRPKARHQRMPKEISAANILAQAHESLVQGGPSRSADLARRIGTEPTRVAIALATDARFVRAVDEHGLIWRLAAVKPAGAAHAG